MARDYGPIYGWHRGDTIPTEAEGGYAGAASTAAAVGTSLAQSGQAVQTVGNLSATATALPAGASPTVTVTGAIPNKVINIGVPQGAPGMGAEEGAILVAQNADTLTAAQQAQADADAAVTLAQQTQAAKLEVPDANVSALIGNPATETRVAGDAQWTPRTEVTERPQQPVNVANYGKSLPSVAAAVAEVSTRAPGAALHFPAGVYDVGNGLDLSGQSYVITGEGAGGTTTTDPAGTVLHATTQAGPVLNLDGWVKAAPDFTGKLTFEGFMLKGNGAPDPTHANAGLVARSLNGVTVRDLVIRDTGGPCIDLLDGSGNSVYLNDFERIILNTPVEAGANDVPYFRAVEANGNRFSRIGLISKLASGLTGDMGPSGAVVIEAGENYATDNNLFDSWWFENLHIPSGASLIVMQGGTRNIWSYPMFFDIKNDAGATDTARLRILPHTREAANHGGNQIIGVIPGGDIAVRHFGVDVRQSRNSITGVKERPGHNVRIAPGVTGTNVTLMGAVSAAAYHPIVVDESDEPSNSWSDAYTSTSKSGTYATDGRTPEQGGSGPRFSDTTSPNNGAVHLGSAGTRFSAIGKTRYDTADAIRFSNVAATGGPAFYLGPTGSPMLLTGSAYPDGAVAANKGSLYLRTNGQAYVKQVGTGSAGWVALNDLT